MKKRILLVVLIFVFLLINSHCIYANVTIDSSDINFDISPQSINNESYLPLDEVEKLIDIKVYKISDKSRVIYYDNNHYILTDKSKKIIGKDKEYLKNVPLVVNEKFLIPMEFVTKILKIDINKNSNDKNVEVPDNSVLFRLLLENNVLKRNSTNEILLLLVNNTDRKKIFKFSSGQKFEIVLKGKHDNVIYRWSRFLKFTQTQTSIKLVPGDSTSFEVNLRLININKGKYKLSAYLVDGNDLRTKEIEVEIK